MRRFLIQEVLELMELCFVQFLPVINRIAYTQNTRLYTQPRRKKDRKGKRDIRKEKDVDNMKNDCERGGIYA